MHGISEVKSYRCDFDNTTFMEKKDAVRHLLQLNLKSIFCQCPDLECRVDQAMKLIDFLGLGFQEGKQGNVEEKVKDLILNNDTIIPAIKFFRDISGSGLKDSKEYVEAVKARFGIETLPRRN